MMAESKVSMKLWIDPQTKPNKVLYAETGKECVDFLFSILSLPLATVIRLLHDEEQGMVGCLSNLYKSVEKLDEMYMQPNQNKDALLKPIGHTSIPLFLLVAGEESRKPLYKCTLVNHYGWGSTSQNSYCIGGPYFSDDQRTICPGCKREMTTRMTYVSPTENELSSKWWFQSTPKSVQGSWATSLRAGSTSVALPVQMVKKVSDEGGFVNGVVTYMVTDDLVVIPLTDTSPIIALLRKFNVKDATALEKMEVHLGLEEAVKLLKTCLHSKEVLTEVFLNNN